MMIAFARSAGGRRTIRTHFEGRARAAWIASTFGVLCLFAGPLLAGVRADFEPADTSSWRRLGVFHVQPSFVIKDVGRDSNVFLTDRNPQGDFTATFSPSTAGVLEFGGRGFLTLKAGADYVWFREISTLSHLNFVLGARGNLNFRALRFFAAAEYTKSKERPSNEIDQRANRINFVERVGAAYELSPDTALDAIVSRERITYRDRDFAFQIDCPDRNADGIPDPGCPTYTLGDLLGRTETIGTLRFSRRVLGRTRAFLDVERRSYDFLAGLPPRGGSGSRPVVGSVKDVRDHRLTAGLELQPGRTLWGVVRVGTSEFLPKELVSQRTRRLVGSADLYWRLGSRLSMHSLLDRDLYFSVYGDNLYFQQDHAGLECVVYLNRYLGLETGYDAYKLVYPLVVGPQGERQVLLFGTHREDEIRRVKGGFRFRLADKAALSVSLALRRRTSNLPGSDDRQLLVATGVETKF